MPWHQYKEPRSAVVTVRVTRTARRKLDSYAQRHQRPMARIVEDLLQSLEPDPEPEPNHCCAHGPLGRGLCVDEQTSAYVGPCAERGPLHVGAEARPATFGGSGGRQARSPARDVKTPPEGK